MLRNWQLRRSAIAGEDFGDGGLVQLNPLGRLLRELQGQLKSRLDRCYLRNLQSKQGSGGVHCGDSRNEINVYKSVEDTTYSGGFVVWALEYPFPGVLGCRKVRLYLTKSLKTEFVLNLPSVDILFYLVNSRGFSEV